MTSSNDTLLRVGFLILDEVQTWHRASQVTFVGSDAWNRSQGAIEALNAMAEGINRMLQVEALEEAGLPIPVEMPQFRVITGGKA